MADGLYLVNYYHANCTPLKSITQLPKKEAFALAEKLYEESPCRAHRRFGPGFEHYYSLRLEAEEWLYHHFVSMGGKPEVEHPYYFTLQQSETLMSNFGDGRQIKLPLAAIGDFDASYTFGDSIAMMDSPGKRPPFLKAELLEHIFSQNNSVETFLGGIQEKCAYIEAQIWTDRYCKDALIV